MRAWSRENFRAIALAMLQLPINAQWLGSNSASRMDLVTETVEVGLHTS